MLQMESRYGSLPCEPINRRTYLKRRRRALVTTVLVVAVALAAAWARKPLVERWQIRRAVTDCLNDRVSPGKVLFEGDPQRARALLATRGDEYDQTYSYADIAAEHRVRAWDGLASRAGLLAFGRIAVFRLSVGRKERLVALGSVGSSWAGFEGGFKALRVGVTVVDPGGFFGRPRLVRNVGFDRAIVVATNLPLRIFGGVVDATDPSTVWFRYELGERGGGGRLRLRLQSDDSVTLVAVNGPIATAAAELERRWGPFDPAKGESDEP
ncbi:MAG TPA: hypothetical protein VH475_15310 [Tepidisphaeraceae bacterium]|jgi:hypothetical protein